MSDARTRLLVIGIDAASPELLDEWIAEGTLPNFAALRARGVSARTRGLDGFFVGSTWPSLYTGTNPAQHGFHYQMQL
ncbi:MAG: alkaline phosphatase family protein, partial [Gemmatimonadaceae bacterium]